MGDSTRAASSDSSALRVVMYVRDEMAPDLDVQEEGQEAEHADLYLCAG